MRASAWAGVKVGGGQVTGRRRVCRASAQILHDPGVGRRVQSRPNPRGNSTSRASSSTSQTPSRSSAVLESARELGQLVAPSLVLGLQGPELGQGRGPPLRPRRRPGRPPLLDGDAGVAALAEAALALGVREGHRALLWPLRNGRPITEILRGRHGLGGTGLHLGLTPQSLEKASAITTKIVRATRQPALSAAAGWSCVFGGGSRSAGAVAAPPRGSCRRLRSWMSGCSRADTR